MIIISFVYFNVRYHIADAGLNTALGWCLPCTYPTQIGYFMSKGAEVDLSRRTFTVLHSLLQPILSKWSDLNRILVFGSGDPLYAT